MSMPSRSHHTASLLAVEGVRRRERDPVVGADGVRQAEFFERALEDGARHSKATTGTSERWRPQVYAEL